MNPATYSQTPRRLPPPFGTLSERIEPGIGMRRQAKLSNKTEHRADRHAENSTILSPSGQLTDYGSNTTLRSTQPSWSPGWTPGRAPQLPAPVSGDASYPKSPS